MDGRSSCYIFVDGHENMVVLLQCKLQDHKHVAVLPFARCLSL